MCALTASHVRAFITIVVNLPDSPIRDRSIHKYSIDSFIAIASNIIRLRPWASRAANPLTTLVFPFFLLCCRAEGRKLCKPFCHPFGEPRALPNRNRLKTTPSNVVVVLEGEFDTSSMRRFRPYCRETQRAICKIYIYFDATFGYASPWGHYFLRRGSQPHERFFSISCLRVLVFS